MAVQIRYMGTKNKLAPIVADIVDELGKGPFLDLFSGMCSVGGAVSSFERPVWCNDIQEYSSLVASALLQTQELPLVSSKAGDVLFGFYIKNLKKLEIRFAHDLSTEDKILKSGDWKAMKRLMDSWQYTGNSTTLAKEAEKLRKKNSTFPYRLCSLTFSHGYFGLKQSIEIDSLRYSIDMALKTGDISKDQYTWLLVALLQAASHITSAPGHFAQFFKVRDQQSFNRIASHRKRSVWLQFITELERLEPYGTFEWRENNRVFNEDALSLSQRLKSLKTPPGVVYADPPYSKAQYSRYYHVLESLVKYDYPEANSTGRYRDDRFQTPFSNASGVIQAFASMIENVAASGASFILSYPSNGLLLEKGFTVDDMLKESYRKVTIKEIDFVHSTMGGGTQGVRNQEVKEMIFVATGAR